MVKIATTPSTRPIEARILELRGERLLLDEHLAEVYGVPTGHLNQAVKRNLERFPSDFVFQLSAAEWRSLKSQIVISNVQRGGRRTRPWVFTEHGAIMAAMVLKSPRAVHTSVFIVRAFARLRELASTHAALAEKLAELERRVTVHDEGLKSVVAALRQLLHRPIKSARQIGFRAIPSTAKKSQAERG